MIHVNEMYPYPYYDNTQMYSRASICSSCEIHQCPYNTNIPMYNNSDLLSQYPSRYIPLNNEVDNDPLITLKDYGPEPFVINIEDATKQNNTYRTALWTGNHLQLTLMSIEVGSDIGLEVHPTVDQFIRIEEGEGIVKMGDSENNLDFQRNVHDDFVILIPAGKWHNLINTGNKPIKLYSIYAPPNHPFGTVHATKAIAEAEEHSNY
ncbi:cupin domain-containing protein [Clostridium sp. CS001]|uniref:cupin domain-containing protein n=1 Tax=Clostridium sp. CS001 TaxID=2880648 RepID=UPI001CF50C27|nr:cupin domain-containing protein [Clostridium sp. CS001]MCB2288652.1 cupin domain-containing protein [Clostridium sp. CS001]